MKKHPYIEQIMQGILLLILISLLVFSVSIFQQVKISSQIIEYTGIVRATSQKAITQELAGRSASGQIKYADRLYRSLQYGNSSLNLSEPTYRNNLMKQSESWNDLKSALETLQEKHSRKNINKVIDMNADYYKLCNDTVSIVQSYSNSMLDTLRRLEYAIVAVLSILAAITAHRSYAAARQLKRISLVEQNAYVDPLTGIGNRQYYNQFIQEMKDSENYCIIFIDIDHLKYVNDHLGHDAGDQYIKKTAAVIRSQFRSTDVMFRLGGDEFVLYVKGCTEEIARRQIERARSIMTSDISQAYDGSFSYGICYVGENSGKTFRYAAAEADQKMYQFKKEHKMNRSE
ncbi:MAG: GGDEF domain-containing protein [Eubacterium sp.]